MTFNELKFVSRSTSQQAKVIFPNGYGASIVIGPFTYGGKEGLYELAVVKVLDPVTKDTELCYTTPITSDVVGYLTPDEVTETLAKIEAL